MSKFISSANSQNEPLFHITKRGDVTLKRAILARVIAVLAALLVCMLLSFILIGINPIQMLVSLVSGSFGTPRRLWKFFKDLSVLLCISVAVTPAFKMKFWNIGAEGQTLMGALGSAGVAFYLGGKVPEWLLLILMLLFSVLIAAVWGLIPALCKAKWGTNETLFTLMMNYLATGIVGYFLLLWTPSGSSTLGKLKHGYLPSFIHEYFVVILLVFLLTIGAYVYLNYSKHGYEIAVVGESSKTALYIGINVKTVIIRTMALSGALCGFAGFLIVSALDHSITATTINGRGFTAIMVSWLAKFNPITMFLTSGLITFLNQGGSQISTDSDIDSSFPSILIGIIIFFIIGCEFFIYYKVNIRKKNNENAEAVKEEK